MSVINLTTTILQQDLDAVVVLFDQIQVFRSTTGQGGPYAEITAVSPEPAVLNGTIAGSFALNGVDLTIVLNNAVPITITFAGTDPILLNSVLTQINTLIPGIATEVPTNTNKLRLTSQISGTASSILISDPAAAILGLSTTKVNGKAARILLAPATSVYKFQDLDGDASYWYKTRFFNSITNAISNFSTERQGDPEQVITVSNLARAEIFLTDLSGRPIEGRKIIFVPLDAFVVPSTQYGVFPSIDRIVAITDQQGYATVELIRGVTTRVFFEGTGYHRTFVVPNIATFDLLQVLATQPDPFDIVQAVPQPIRVS